MLLHNYLILSLQQSLFLLLQRQNVVSTDTNVAARLFSFIFAVLGARSLQRWLDMCCLQRVVTVHLHVLKALSH